MKLIIRSEKKENYLREIPPYITFSTPLVQEKVREICEQAETDEDRARLAFEFVRDEVQHSFDDESSAVSISAEDTLKNKEGICFAKSHLLASILRGMGIPAGFCYQRVFRTPQDAESSYALHGLNALYLEEHGWFRLDPRGNKPGVDAQFAIFNEKLAYPIREELGEIDYPDVFIEPLAPVLRSMENSKDSEQLFCNLPESI